MAPPGGLMVLSDCVSRLQLYFENANTLTFLKSILWGKVWTNIHQNCSRWEFFQKNASEWWMLYTEGDTINTDMLSAVLWGNVLAQTHVLCILLQSLRILGTEWASLYLSMTSFFCQCAYLNEWNVHDTAQVKELVRMECWYRKEPIV